MIQTANVGGNSCNKNSDKICMEYDNITEEVRQLVKNNKLTMTANNYPTTGRKFCTEATNKRLGITYTCIPKRIEQDGETRGG